MVKEHLTALAESKGSVPSPAVVDHYSSMVDRYSSITCFFFLKQTREREENQSQMKRKEIVKVRAEMNELCSTGNNQVKCAVEIKGTRQADTVASEPMATQPEYSKAHCFIYTHRVYAILTIPQFYVKILTISYEIFVYKERNPTSLDEASF